MTGKSVTMRDAGRVDERKKRWKYSLRDRSGKDLRGNPTGGCTFSNQHFQENDSLRQRLFFKDGGKRRGRGQ